MTLGETPRGSKAWLDLKMVSPRATWRNNGRYRLDNTPWFALGVAADDVVAASADEEGVLWFTDRIEWSGRLTIRVILLSEGPLAGDLQAVLDSFAPLGVSGEGALPTYAIVALDIPPDVDKATVKARLRAGETDGSWAYEEGCVDDAWLAL